MSKTIFICTITSFYLSYLFLVYAKLVWDALYNLDGIFSYRIQHNETTLILVIIQMKVSHKIYCIF